MSVTQSRNFAHDDEAEVLVRNDPGSESRNERKKISPEGPKKVMALLLLDPRQGGEVNSKVFSSSASSSLVFGDEEKNSIYKKILFVGAL